MKIYVINGYPGSGKDTFVDMCNELTGIHVLNLLTSTPQKKVFHDLGWNGAKTPKTRKGLADLMEISNRLFDTSFQYISKEIAKASVTNITHVFIHCREPENITRYKEAFDAETVFLVREQTDIASNDSDRNVWKYKYDFYVYNDATLAELRELAHTFIQGGGQ